MANIDKIKRDLVKQLESDLPNIEKRLYDEVLRFIDTFSSTNGNFTDGYISATKLNELRLAIDRILQQSGYVQNAQLFIRDLGKITINNFTLLNESGFSNFSRLALNEMERTWQQATVNMLLGSGINENFKTPILQAVNDAIMYGNSIQDTRSLLETFIIGGKEKNSKLKSYLTVTSRDVVSQMQGQQMNRVAISQGYDYIQYTGGIIGTSRGQCVRWFDELNGIIRRDDLKDEIALAYKGQREKWVTTQELNGEEVKHRWSGMMPNTTEENFIIKRGGYGCLHTATPRKDKRNMS